MIAAPSSANRAAISSSRRNRASCQLRRSNTASRTVATTVNTSRSRTCLRRLYHVDRLIPSTSDGRCAGASRLYPMRAPPALGPQPRLLTLFRCQCHFLQVPKDGRLDWQTNKRQVVNRPSLLLMAFTNIRRVAAPLPPRRLDGRLGYEPVFRATAVATKPLRSDWS